MRVEEIWVRGLGSRGAQQSGPARGARRTGDLMSGGDQGGDGGPPQDAGRAGHEHLHRADIVPRAPERSIRPDAIPCWRDRDLADQMATVDGGALVVGALAEHGV